MDACPDFVNRGGWPFQSVLTLSPIEGFETTSIRLLKKFCHLRINGNAVKTIPDSTRKYIFEIK
jgi:hypothetical protein